LEFVGEAYEVTVCPQTNEAGPSWLRPHSSIDCLRADAGLEDRQRNWSAAELRQRRNVLQSNRLVELGVGGLNGNRIGSDLQGFRDLTDFKRNCLT